MDQNWKLFFAVWQIIGSLGQMEAQVRLFRQCAPPSVPPLVRSADITKYQAFDPNMKVFNRTFAPLTSYINSLGCATIDGSVYVPVVPASELSIVVVADEDIVVDGTAPDSYCVTLSTLRDTVVYLSDPNSSLPHRRYFAERNPIPGARWNNNYRLLNADNIIPPNYDNQDLREDLIKIRDYADQFKDKALYAQGTLNYDGKGSPSILVSGNCFRRTRYTREGINIIPYDSKLEDHYSTRSLTGADWLTRTTSLYGEYPDPFYLANDVPIRRSAFESRTNHGVIERYSANGALANFYCEQMNSPF